MIDLDPQRSLVGWWKRRGDGDNPTTFEGVESALDARERAELAGYDWCFMDGPPAFLRTLQEMVQAADFVLIPVKASIADLQATEDAIILTRDAGTDFLLAFNDVADRDRRLADSARAALEEAGIPMARTVIMHRNAFITGLNAGKSAAEVNGGRDIKAAAEINALWQEVKALATKAAKARAGRAAGVAAR